MLKVYSVYICLLCKKEMILLKEDIELNEKQNKFLRCPYCSSKKIKLENEEDSLKEVMKSRSYKRVKGAIQARR